MQAFGPVHPNPPHCPHRCANGPELALVVVVCAADVRVVVDRVVALRVVVAEAIGVVVADEISVVETRVVVLVTARVVLVTTGEIDLIALATAV